MVGTKSRHAVCDADCEPPLNGSNDLHDPDTNIDHMKQRCVFNIVGSLNV